MSDQNGSDDSSDDEYNYPISVANTVDWDQRVTDALRQLEADSDTNYTTDGDATFRISTAAYAPESRWLAFVKKMGMTHTDDELLGTFHTGTMIHDFFETHVSATVENVVAEQRVETTFGDLTFVGHFDAYDYVNDVVYDFKSRGGWYRFDPPVERHVNQLQMYMDALDAQYGKIVYVSKKDLEIREWPSADDIDGTGSPTDTVAVERDHGTFLRVAEACADVAAKIRNAPDDPMVGDIPYERGDDYIEQNTDIADEFTPDEATDGSELNDLSDDELAEMEPSDT